MDEFPNELVAVRKRQAKAKSLLIVMIDSDNESVEIRAQALKDRLVQSKLEPVRLDDPLALLIPKRHIETWIRALLGERVTEEEDCKKHNPPTKDDFRQAALKLYDWSRPNAAVPPNCVPSLSQALKVWHRIGSQSR
jgi:hypothetical protein